MTSEIRQRGSRRPARPVLVAGVVMALLATGAHATAAPRANATDEPFPIGACQRIDGRCVGIDLLPSPAGRGAGLASPATVPALDGLACPGTTLGEPARDDWCERWVVQRDLGPHGVSEVPKSIAVTPDGTEVAVLAQAATADPLGAAILVFDAATGAWRRTIAIPYRFFGPGTEYYPYLFAAGADAFYVSGLVLTREETAEGFANHRNFLTLAYDRAGALLWSSRYRGPMSGLAPEHGDWPTSMNLSADGSRLVVAGVSTRSGPFQKDPWFGRDVAPDDVATVAYDTGTGTQRWVERFDSGDLEFPWGISTSGDALYVNTLTWGYRSRILAYRGMDGTDPTLAWSHAEDPSTFLASIAMTATRGGVVIVGLSLKNPSGTIDYGVVALDHDGGVRWRATHSNVYTIAGTNYTSTDVPMGMVADDDRVYVTGYAYEWDALYAAGDPSPAMVPSTVAFDASTGARAWARTYRFPGHRIHFPMALHLSGGRLYVPGMDSECNYYISDPSYYCQSTTINLVTLDYATSSGTLQRVARFNHARIAGIPGTGASPPTAPGFTFIGPSAVAPGDRLYVTAAFDAPCFDCWPGARYRMGILGY